MCLMSTSGLLTNKQWTFKRLQWRFPLKEGAIIFSNKFGISGFWALGLHLKSCVEPLFYFFVVCFLNFKTNPRLLHLFRRMVQHLFAVKLQKCLMNMCGVEWRMKVGVVQQLDQHETCEMWLFESELITLFCLLSFQVRLTSDKLSEELEGRQANLLHQIHHELGRLIWFPDWVKTVLLKE